MLILNLICTFILLCQSNNALKLLRPATDKLIAKETATEDLESKESPDEEDVDTGNVPNFTSLIALVYPAGTGFLAGTNR